MKKIWILSSLIMILVTFYQITTTYAKYQSEASGEVKEDIGVWIVKLNGTNIATGTVEEQFTVDKLNTYTTENVLDGKLAPGAIGYFDVQIDATEASVAIKYDVTIDSSEMEVNNSMSIYKMTVLVDNEEKEDIAIRTAKNTYTGTIGINDIKEGKAHIARVYVKWENDETGANNERDTTLGSVEGTSFSVPITLRASQYIGEEIVEYST